MGAAYSSKTPLNFHQCVRRHISEDSTLDSKNGWWIVQILKLLIIEFPAPPSCINLLNFFTKLSSFRSRPSLSVLKVLNCLRFSISTDWKEQDKKCIETYRTEAAHFQNNTNELLVLLVKFSVPSVFFYKAQCSSFIARRQVQTIKKPSKSQPVRHNRAYSCFTRFASYIFLVVTPEHTFQTEWK
jgi:hypothetical protein